MKKRKTINFSNENIFIAIFAALFVLYLLSRIALHVLHREGLGEDFFFFNKKDYFMDFFNPLFFSSQKNPYDIKDLGAIYPPICYLLYRFILLFVPASDIVDRFAIRENRMLLMILMIITILTVLLITVQIQNKLTLSQNKKNIVVFCVAMSFPFLFTVERANILLLCLVLVLFFSFYHDSSNKILSELSLIALAVAAAIKLYPAVFGALLFFEEKINAKKVFRCVVYGALAFFLPFLAFGPSSLVDFVNNLSSGIKDTESIRNPWLCIDVRTFVDWINVHKSFNAEAVSVAFIAFMAVITVLFLLLTKSMFKRVLALAVATVLIPSFVYTYGTIMLIIPLLFWLKEEPQNNDGRLSEIRFSRIYGVILTVIMAPIPIFSNNVKCLLLITALYLLITAETVLLAVRRLKDRGKRPHMIAAGGSPQA